MDLAIPPSYAEATNREWLPLIAPFLDNLSLCSASRVSKKWHDTLVPHLWGHPALHFSRDIDNACVALTRFVSCLPSTRIEIRRLTHTLYLSPTVNDLYNEPQSQLLQDVLELLPNLQCLVVPGTPFFDHAALVQLKTPSARRTGDPPSQPSAFSLRLLIATQCINCTPTSLTSAIEEFSGLIFLDLSWTVAARDGNVLATIGFLPHLQILKLRCIGLQDHHFRVLANSLNPRQVGRSMYQHTYRLRSLDIRDNLLTDESVKLIAARLINPAPSVPDFGWNHELRAREEGILQASTRVVSQMKQRLQKLDIDRFFIKTLSNYVTGYGHLQDFDRVGLTHLYLANNPITSEGLMTLADINNLYVLNIGNISHGVNPLTWLLKDSDPSTPTHLRINHVFLTTLATISSRAVRPGDVQEPHRIDEHEARDTSLPRDIPETHSGPAVSSLGVLPHYEQTTGLATKTEQSPKAMLDQESQPEDPPSYAESSASITTDATTRPTFVDGSKVISRVNATDTEPLPEIQQFTGTRQGLGYGSRSQHRGLVSGLTSTIQTLVLTGIPVYTQSPQLIYNLQNFIAACAAEHYLAKEKARAEQPSSRIYGMSSEEAIELRSQELFALRKIILELAPQRSGTSEAELLPSPPTSPIVNRRTAKSQTWSSVDDRDVDMFWEAAKNDFSFFDEEQTGLSDIKAGKRPAQPFHVAKTIPSMASVSINHKYDIPGARLTNSTIPPLHDVVAEIANWRVDKRKEVQAAPSNIFVPGAWPGKIEIIRLGGKPLHDALESYSKSFGMDKTTR